MRSTTEEERRKLAKQTRWIRELVGRLEVALHESEIAREQALQELQAFRKQWEAQPAAIPGSHFVLESEEADIPGRPVAPGTYIVVPGFGAIHVRHGQVQVETDKDMRVSPQSAYEIVIELNE